MDTAPPSTGLKGQWGVGDPQGAPTAGGGGDAGSDKQAQEFQAAFQQLQGVMNGHLQYTAANAEASAHAGFAARRDATYSAFQAAAAKIDRNNPAQAQGAIDQVLADENTLGSEVASFRQAAEKAKNDWDAKQPQYDEAVHHIEELEAWEDKAAPALRTQADAIRTQTNERRYAEASTALDALLAQLAPVYEEYVRQRDAKAKYEPARDALADRVAKAAGTDRARLQPERDAVATANQAMEASAGDKNFVQALDQVGDLTGKLEAFEAALEELDRKKQEFETANADLEQKLTKVQQSTFRKLEPQQQEITTGKAAVDAAAATEDYDQAMTLASELANKCEQYRVEEEKLEEQRTAYETAWAALQDRYQQTATSEFRTLEPLQQELVAIKASIDSAVQAEDFAQALAQVNDLATKVDTFLAARDKLQQQRTEYETAWATVGPKVTQALQGTSTKLAPQREDLGAAQQQVEAAVQAEAFDQALAQANDLGTKADAYIEAERVLAEQKQRYETALSALQGDLDTVAKSGSPALAEFNEEITRIRAQMDQAVQAEDYEQALAHAEDLRSKVKTYLDELAKARADYEAKRTPIETGMKEVNECGFSTLQARKTEITTDYDAMVKLAQAEDYKAASEAADKLAPQVSDFGAQRAKAAGVVHQKIYPRLTEIQNGMKQFQNEKSPLKDQVNALLESIQLGTVKGDAEFEAAGNDMDKLSALFNQLKDDPCLKAKRSPDYVKAVQAEAQARADAKPLWTALEKAKMDYLKPLGGQALDPNQALEVRRAEDAVRAAELRKFQAAQEVNRVLASFSCGERIDEVRLEPPSWP